MKTMMTSCLFVFFCLCSSMGGASENRFVGADACGECHEEQYTTYISSSRKAHSFESIKKMEAKLTPEEYQACFQCHTTGGGRETGFVSEAATPGLRNAGCEVCHGPGSLHVESGGDIDLIRADVGLETCKICHNEERVNAFKYQPLLFGGAH